MVCNESFEILRKLNKWKTKKRSVGPESYSRWTVSKNLIRNGLHGRVAVKKPFLRKENREKRLRYDTGSGLKISGNGSYGGMIKYWISSLIYSFSIIFAHVSKSLYLFPVFLAISKEIKGCTCECLFFYHFEFLKFGHYQILFNIFTHCGVQKKIVQTLKAKLTHHMRIMPDQCKALLYSTITQWG